MASKEGTLRTKSSASCSSKRSKASSTGAAAAMARAKAEAARARLSFAKKEMALKVEKAQLEATMDMLSLEQETAAAVAEAEVLEAAADCSDRSSSKSHLDLQHAAPLDPTERTKEYVAEQAKEQNKRQFAPPLHLPSQDEIRQSHTEPASALPIRTPHMKEEHSRVDINPFSTTPNQMLTAQQPQHTPKENIYSINIIKIIIVQMNQGSLITVLPFLPCPAMHLYIPTTTNLS